MTPASTPYPAYQLPDFGLCIAHRSRFLDPDTRLHEEKCR